MNQSIEQRQGSVHEPELLSQFKFWDYADHTVAKERFRGNRRFGLYSSEASAIANEDGYRYVVGGCHRATAYRVLNIPPSNPPSIKSLRIMKFGNIAEEMIREEIKESGIFEASSVKFFYAKHKISGELDLVVHYPGDLNKYIITEIKSTWGYYNKKSLSSGKPKDANFCQILTYLWAGIDDPQTYNYASQVIGGKLVYILRDSLDRYEFDIAIYFDENGVPWPMVNGIVDKRFSILEIMRRYDILLQHMANIQRELSALPPSERTVENSLQLNSLPPRDYALKYSDDEIEFLHEHGDITKTNYQKWEKDKSNIHNRPGHWMCSYCRWKDICWGPQDIEQHINSQPLTPNIQNMP